MARAPQVTADFPFYDGWPIFLSAWRWLLVLVCVAAGFAALVGPAYGPGQWGHMACVLAFVAIPLAGLRFAAGPHWTSLFRAMTPREVGLSLLFVPLTMGAAGLVAIGIMRLAPTAANPSAAMLLQLKGGPLALFLTSTAPQLFGEELITILPLLALLTLFHQALKLPRGVALVLAWILSSALFAALHLPTYQWNLVQCLAVIGTSRLMLSLPYLITRNIWASTLTHVTHDWLIFALVLAAPTLG